MLLQQVSILLRANDENVLAKRMVLNQFYVNSFVQVTCLHFWTINLKNFYNYSNYMWCHHAKMKTLKQVQEILF